jgi:hypothetical protein
MPPWMLDVDAFMTMYPGLTPDDVLNMDADCFDWLPVVRAARMKAEEMRAAGSAGAASFGRRGPGG